ncbi:hypothetical protein ABH931_000205 [Streptacidiphilus sp. MAP12-33]|uniref:hypothetical protein n=1 Tax=Streptacidiphilus sp. MAP12-33 TaxID=3156266 RepID=UPI00351360A6
MNAEAVAQPSQPAAAPGQQPDSSQPRRPRRVTAAAVAFVLSAVAVGGVTGGLILAARSHSTPPAPVAQAPLAAPPFGVRPDGSHFGPLGELLLPVPSNAAPGADVAGFGNDTVLSPDRYASMFQREFRFLSTGARASLQSELGLPGVKGYALRTYADTDDGLSIEITVIQEDAAHVSALQQGLRTLDSATGGMRSGPQVGGFPHAHCYQPPDPYGSALDLLRCDDVEGDLLITMQAEGVSPLPQSAAADFLRNQLSRLATPAAQV